jgi:hypothetical protein
MSYKAAYASNLCNSPSFFSLVYDLVLSPNSSMNPLRRLFSVNSTLGFVIIGSSVISIKPSYFGGAKSSSSSSKAD